MLRVHSADAARRRVVACCCSVLRGYVGGKILSPGPPAGWSRCRRRSAASLRVISRRCARSSVAMKVSFDERCRMARRSQAMPTLMMRHRGDNTGHTTPLLFTRAPCGDTRPIASAKSIKVKTLGGNRGGYRSGPLVRSSQTWYDTRTTRHAALFASPGANPVP